MNRGIPIAITHTIVIDEITKTQSNARTRHRLITNARTVATVAARRGSNEREKQVANKVTVQVLGGEPKVLDGVQTVGDVKQKLSVMGHTASINGDPAKDSDELDDYSFVNLSPAVKGA